MRFKLDVMFALFLGQQYDTLTDGLTANEVEATAMCINSAEINCINWELQLFETNRRKRIARLAVFDAKNILLQCRKSRTIYDNVNAL